jgi:hypothetical protein
MAHADAGGSPEPRKRQCDKAAAGKKGRRRDEIKQNLVKKITTLRLDQLGPASTLLMIYVPAKVMHGKEGTYDTSVMSLS